MVVAWRQCGIGLTKRSQTFKFYHRMAYFADWRGRRIPGRALLPLLCFGLRGHIANRTASRAEALAKIFAHTGSVHATDMVSWMVVG